MSAKGKSGFGGGGGGASGGDRETPLRGGGGSGEYKEFNDMPAKGWGGKVSGEDGWEYAGSGKEQKDFFGKSSNAEEIYDEINDDQYKKDAYMAWASGRFMGGAQYRGWDNMTDKQKERTQIYDDTLDKSVITKGVVVTRLTDAQLIMGAGHARASLEQLQSMEGRIVTSKGNMSCAAAKHGLTIGDSSKNVELRIHIPEGAKGAGMWIGDKRVNPSWQAKQREFMTNRDSVFRVGKTTYNGARKTYVVDVYWEGHTSHEYGKSGRMNPKDFTGGTW